MSLLANQRGIAKGALSRIARLFLFVMRHHLISALLSGGTHHARSSVGHLLARRFASGCICFAMEGIRPSMREDGRHSTIDCQEDRLSARIILGIDSPAAVRVAETGVELVRVSDPSSTPAVSAEPSFRQSNPQWSIYEPLPQTPCSRPPLPQTGDLRRAPRTRKATQAASHSGTSAE